MKRFLIIKKHLLLFGIFFVCLNLLSADPLADASSNAPLTSGNTAIVDWLLGKPNLTFTDPVWDGTAGGETSTLMLNATTAMRWQRIGDTEGGAAGVYWRTADNASLTNWTKPVLCTGFPAGQGWFPFVTQEKGVFYMTIKLGKSGKGGAHYFYQSTDGKDWSAMNNGKPILVESDDPANLHYINYNAPVAFVGSDIYMFLDSQAVQGKYAEDTYVSMARATLSDLSQFQSTLKDAVFPRGMAGATMPIYIPERHALLLLYAFSGDLFRNGAVFNIQMKADYASTQTDLFNISNWRMSSMAWPNLGEASDFDVFFTPGKAHPMQMFYNGDQNVDFLTYGNASSAADLYDRLLGFDFSDQDAVFRSLTLGKKQKDQWATLDVEAHRDDADDFVHFFHPSETSGLNRPGLNAPRMRQMLLGKDRDNFVMLEWDNPRQVGRLAVGKVARTGNIGGGFPSDCYNRGRVEIEGWANNNALAKALYLFRGTMGIHVDHGDTPVFGTGDFTLSFLAKPTTTGAGTRQITSGVGALDVNINGSTLRVGKAGEASSFVEFPDAVALDELHLYTIIRNQGLIAVYRDDKAMWNGGSPWHEFKANLTGHVMFLGGESGNFFVGQLGRYNELPYAIGDQDLLALFSQGGQFTDLLRAAPTANLIADPERNSTFNAGASDWTDQGSGSTVAVTDGKLQVKIADSDQFAFLPVAAFNGGFEPGKSYTISMKVEGYGEGTLRVAIAGLNQSVIEQDNPGLISQSFVANGPGTGLQITILRSGPKIFTIDNVVIRPVTTGLEMADACESAGSQVDDLSGKGGAFTLPANAGTTRFASSMTGKVSATISADGYIGENENVVPAGYVITGIYVKSSAANLALYDSDVAANESEIASFTSPANGMIKPPATQSQTGKIYIKMAAPSKTDVTIWFSKL